MLSTIFSPLTSLPPSFSHSSPPFLPPTCHLPYFGVDVPSSSWFLPLPFYSFLVIGGILTFSVFSSFLSSVFLIFASTFSHLPGFSLIESVSSFLSAQILTFSVFASFLSSVFLILASTFSHLPVFFVSSSFLSSFFSSFRSSSSSASSSSFWCSGNDKNLRRVSLSRSASSGRLRRGVNARRFRSVALA